MPAQDASRATTPPGRAGFGVDAALLLMVVVWAGNMVVLKKLLDAFPPAALSAVRFTAVSLLAYAVVAWRGGPWRMKRADLPRLGAAALTGVAAYQILFMEALDRSSVFATNLLQGTEPLFALALVRALGIERVRKRQWLGVGVALIGTVLFFQQDQGAGASIGFGFGDLINLVSAASFAIYGLVGAPLFARYPGRTVMAHTMGLGTLPLLAYGLPELHGADWASIPASAWTVAVLSGTLAVYVGYWIWNWAIGAKGLAHVSLYLFLDILLSGVFAFLLLGERFGTLRLLGAAVILLGVHLAAQRLPPEPAA
jgi:drug/metabolite transporter (DMT)-like permease